MNNRSLTAYIQSVALAAPGLNDWQSAQVFLRGEQAFQFKETAIPEPKIISAREKRRASRTVKLSLAMAEQAQQQAGIGPKSLMNIFVSSHGDTDIFNYLCNELAEPEPAISPTQFHHSLHNSAVGYWGIASGSTLSSNAISAKDYSFTAGLLEATLHSQEEQKPILLALYDCNPSAPINQCNPITYWFGAALVITPKKTDQSLAKYCIELPTTQNLETTMNDSNLEILRKDNPAAAILPLLQALVKKNNHQEIYCNYFSNQQMKIILQDIK